MADLLSPRINSRDYEHILSAGLPLLDVRAPVEFAGGTFAQSVNLPLMQDDERAAVGTCYKRAGQQAAIELGHSLVKDDIRSVRIAEWKQWCAAHPDGYLCCARGGLRSHIVQQWLHDAGIDFPLVEGGYRALRQHALSRMTTLSALPLIIIGGNTGCGKTDLIRTLNNGIDLEGIARHRGSSFGRTLQQQPSQASFEHLLATTLMRRQRKDAGFHWVLEDEGAMIGSRHIPDCLRERMAQSPVVVIDDPFELRLERLKHDYFEQMLADFMSYEASPDSAWAAFGDYLQHGLFAIRRRLGSERFISLSSALTTSLERHRNANDAEAHFAWLVPLLKEYYDPMYRYQLDKKRERIVFSGDYRQVSEWLAEA